MLKKITTAASVIALCASLAGGNLEAIRCGGRALREGVAVRNALLAVRELFMLWLVRWGLRHGADVKVTASYPYEINLLGWVAAAGNLSSSTTERVE